MDEKCRVVFSIDDNYVPYLSVAILSLLDNISDGHEYEIIVLYDQLLDENIERIINIVERSKKEATISFVCIHEQMKNYDLYLAGGGNENYLSATTYYRLLLHALLPNVKKVLYLDSDIVLNADVYELYNTDVTGFYAAGVADITDNWKCSVNKEGLKEYRVETLKIESDAVFDYVNAGVLVMNLDEIRSQFEAFELMDIAQSRQWTKHDQDVINSTFRGKIRNISLKWNVIQAIDDRFYENTNKSDLDEYKEANDKPLLVHFAAIKPWLYTNVNHQELFWKYAAKTEYSYDFIMGLIDNSNNNIEAAKQIVEKAIDNKVLGKRYSVSLIVKLLKGII